MRACAKSCPIGLQTGVLIGYEGTLALPCRGGRGILALTDALIALLKGWSFGSSGNVQLTCIILHVHQYVEVYAASSIGAEAETRANFSH